MEELFQEISKFARNNLEALKPVEKWLNENDFESLIDAWEIAVNEFPIDWRKIVFLAWLASDEKIYECDVEIDGVDLNELCGVNKKGSEDQIMFQLDIFSGTYSTKQHPNKRLIQNALEKGKNFASDDLIRINVAIQRFRVSRGTIKRAIRDGKIKSYRAPDAPTNSPHLVSESELSRHYPRW